MPSTPIPSSFDLLQAVDSIHRTLTFINCTSFSNTEAQHIYRLPTAVEVPGFSNVKLTLNCKTTIVAAEENAIDVQGLKLIKADVDLHVSPCKDPVHYSGTAEDKKEKKKIYEAAKAIAETVKVSLNSSAVEEIMKARVTYACLDGWLHSRFCRKCRSEEKADFLKLQDLYEWQAYKVAEGQDPTCTSPVLVFHIPSFDKWIVVYELEVTEETTVFLFTDLLDYIVLDSESVKRDVRCVQHYANRTNVDESSSFLLVGACAYYGIENKTIKDAICDPDVYNDLVDTATEEFSSQQADPFMSEEALQGEELHFAQGSMEQMTAQLTTLCHATIPFSAWERHASSGAELYVRSSHEGCSAHISMSDTSYETHGWASLMDSTGITNFSYIFETAANAIIEYNEPRGHTWEYNDGAYDRMSGYDKYGVTMRVEISAPSAHEQLCARMELKDMSNIIGKATLDKLMSSKKF